MKTKNIIYLILVSLLFSCNGQIKEKANNNALLADKVTTQYIVYLKDSSLSKEWIGNFDKDYLYKNTFHQIFDNNFIVYNPDPTIMADSGGVTTRKQMLANLNWDSVSNNYDELNALVFMEEWSIDTNITRFTKTVKVWSPVRIFYPKEEKENPFKTKICNISPKENKKGHLICKDIYSQSYIYGWVPMYPFYWGLDFDKFLTLVFKKIENKEIIAYDPICLVDKSKRPLSLEDINKSAGCKINSKKLRQHIAGLVFKEDWYFDKETLNIYKEVKSLGFVFFDRKAEIEKTLFFIDFE